LQRPFYCLHDIGGQTTFFFAGAQVVHISEKGAFAASIRTCEFEKRGLSPIFRG